MRAAFATFGCKLNQYETEALASSFADQGFFVVPASEEAELYVVNTCTVTSRGEQKARRTIRGLSRRRPAALLVVTGCYAQLGEAELAALGPNVRVVPQDRKSGLLDLARLLEGHRAAASETPTRGTAGTSETAGTPLVAAESALRALAARPAAEDPFRYRVGAYHFHSRAFLKIQDGCDCRCTYCRVPLARGPSVCLEPREVLARTAAIEEAGIREVVLTGVNISSWEADGLDLAGLLRGLLDRTSRPRVRLSSLEPERMNEALAEVLRHPRVCPHFHLPVQSGSASVLRRMRRRYGPEGILRAVDLLRAGGRDPFLAADVLVGFPGEAEEDFAATRALLERLDFSCLHVFPFSPRPGTPAADMGPRVPERVRDRRAAELLALSGQLLERYSARWRGREEEAVLEERAAEGRQDGWRGLTGNYLRVRVTGVPGSAARPGGLVRVRLGEAGSARFLSEA